MDGTETEATEEVVMVVTEATSLAAAVGGTGRIELG